MSGQWEQCLQPLVSEVIARKRSALLEQVGKVYKVVALDRLAVTLGMDVAAARKACEQQTWTFDDAGYAHPTPPGVGEDIMRIGEAQLGRLAEYVAYLEQP